MYAGQEINTHIGEFELLPDEEANRTIVDLSGNIGRDKVVRRSLVRFILGPDKDIFYHHRGKLFSTVEVQVGDLQFDITFLLHSGRKK